MHLLFYNFFANKWQAQNFQNVTLKGEAFKQYELTHESTLANTGQHIKGAISKFFPVVLLQLIPKPL